MASHPRSQHPDPTLFLYLDDTADREFRAHIAHCESCATHLRELRLVSGALSASLRRATCPPPLQLGEYSLGLLNAAETARMEGHLAGCPHCAAELRTLDTFMALPDFVDNPSRLEAIVTPVRVLIARLAGGLRQPVPQPAFAALRGESAGPITYQAGDYRAVIEIDEDFDNPGRRSLTGLLIGPAAAGATAHLWQNGQRRTTGQVDAYGNFEFNNLEPDTYELIISGSDVEIHIQSLPVG